MENCHCRQIPGSRHKSRPVDLRFRSKFTLWILYHDHLQWWPPTVTVTHSSSVLFISLPSLFTQDSPTEWCHCFLANSKKLDRQSHMTKISHQKWVINSILTFHCPVKRDSQLTVCLCWCLRDCNKTALLWCCIATTSEERHLQTSKVIFLICSLASFTVSQIRLLCYMR